MITKEQALEALDIMGGNSTTGFDWNNLSIVKAYIEQQSQTTTIALNPPLPEKLRSGTQRDPRPEDGLSA